MPGVDSLTAFCSLCGLAITAEKPDAALLGNVPAEQLDKTAELAMFDKFAATFSAHISEKHKMEQAEMMAYMGLIGKLYAVRFAASMNPEFKATRDIWTDELYKAIRKALQPADGGVAAAAPAPLARAASSLEVSNSKKSFRKDSN